MSETIGFIGLGKMGEPMARNPLRAGYKLRVYNRTSSKAQALAGEGAAVMENCAMSSIRTVSWSPWWPTTTPCRNLLNRVAAARRTPMPLGTLLQERLQTAVNKGRSDMDWTALAIGASEGAGLRKD